MAVTAPAVIVICTLGFPKLRVVAPLRSPRLTLPTTSPFPDDDEPLPMKSVNDPVVMSPLVKPSVPPTARLPCRVVPLELFSVRLLSAEMPLGTLMPLAEPPIVIDDVESALRFAG